MAAESEVHRTRHTIATAQWLVYSILSDSDDMTMFSINNHDVDPLEQLIYVRTPPLHSYINR
jgi:hypothetical protein